MKSSLSLIFAALVVLLGSVIWLVNERPLHTPPQMLATDATPLVRIVAVPTSDVPAAAAPVKPTPAAVMPVAATPPAVAAPKAVVAPVPVAKTAPMVHIDNVGNVVYVARAGDTVSQLAIALLGSDSKENRDAVIASDATLMDNPNLVLEGHGYSIAQVTVADAEPSKVKAAAPEPVVDTSAAVLSSATITPAVTETTDESPKPAKLSYIAMPGDSVSVLAGNLLGGDTKENRELIIAENPSLHADPDHLVAGKTYTINAVNGLGADPAAPQAKLSASEPDADEAAKMSVGRTLRYTAQAGDTVSSLAIALLGSDTPTNRALIVNSNASLKRDPDHLVAGRTYWIAAPSAEGAR